MTLGSPIFMGDQKKGKKTDYVSRQYVGNLIGFWLDAHLGHFMLLLWTSPKYVQNLFS